MESAKGALVLNRTGSASTGSAGPDVARGRGSPHNSKPRAAGSVGLVADLSNKLARQRKQLDELVAQNAAKKSTWKWHHVLGLILLNNLVVMVVGIAAGSAFYGVGPIAEGSFKSGKIKAEGLSVVSDDGPQHVVIESTQGSSDLVVRAAAGAESKVVLGGAEAPERFSMVSSGEDYFAIRQGNVDRLSLVTDSEGVTDMHLVTSGDGEVVINDDLSLGRDKIRTRNGTLHIESAEDIVLAPQGAGIVQVAAPLEVEGSLTVGNPSVLAVDAPARTVTIGSEDASADLTVMGEATFSDTVTIQNGGITVLNGDVRFGNADVHTEGDLTVAGDVTLGDSADDLVTIRGMLKVLNDDGTAVVQIHPATGDVQLMGSLTVEQNTELRGDVILGSKPTDTVTINAYATQMNSLIATGFVQLGDDDDDTITVYGSLRVRNSNNDIVFDVDPHTGNTYTQGSLTVSGDTTFAGSLNLGDGSTDENGNLEDVIEIYGKTTMEGDVTIKSDLHVLGDTIMKDVYADNVTLVGQLRLLNAQDEVTFSVDPETGNVFSAGALTVEGDARFMHDVVLGDAQDDHIRINGQVLMRASLTTEKDVTIMGDTTVEADTEILGDLGIGGELRVAGDVYLGDDPSDEIILRGHLIVKSGSRSTFTVDPTTGNVMTQGSLTVVGKSFFESSVEIDSHLTVEGETVLRSGLEVAGATTIDGDLSVFGDTEIGGELHVQGDLQVDGDVKFGSTDSNELTIRGHLLLRNDVGATQFRVNSGTGDTYTAGSLRVDGPATFAGSVILGSSAADEVTIHATTVLHAGMIAEADVDILGELTVQGDTTLHSDLIVHGNVQLGDDASDVVTVVGDFQVIDAGGEPKFTIDGQTGDALSAGSMKVNGNLDVDGYITTPEFVVEHLFVDQISERTPNAGVTIEGVRFRDGGIDWTKAHEINEMIEGEGVTIEGVNMKDGSVTLSGKRVGASPSGEVDLLTLVNTGHDRNMTDTMTTMKWRQFYHDEQGGNHAPVDSASISVGTENDWTEDSSTHNAYMAFYTSYRGEMAERMRITSQGDLRINNDKIVLHGKTGDAEIAGNVYIGGDSESRQLTVSSTENEAVVRIVSGGQADAKLSLTSPLGGGGNMSTFEIVNDGSAVDHPVLRFTDGPDNNDLMTLTDTGTSGDLFVSGNLQVGSSDSVGLHQVVVESGGDAEILVSAGENSDASVIITSGVDRNARLVLVDPGDDDSGSVFQIYNDGSANVNPALRFADGDQNDLVSIIDVGGVGELHVSGDAQFGDMNSVGPRTVTVQSNDTASLNVISRESDAFVKIQSGIDKRASLILLDPADSSGRTWADGTPDLGAEFHIFNDGASLDYPTLRITDGGRGHANQQEHTLLSIVDRGTVGDLFVTGNGMFGGPDAIGDRTLTVQSSEEASVHVTSGGSSPARVVITSGPQQSSILSLVDPGTVDANGNVVGSSKFELMNDGSQAVPTFKITDGTHDMIKILDRGTTGDLIVSGNGMFGGPDALGARTLVVQSADAADIQIISGTGHDATMTIQSGSNQDARLVLEDPAPGALGSKFIIVNKGGKPVPTLQVTDAADNVMMQLVDTGSYGDLTVTGSGTFGGDSIAEDRTLSVKSGMQAQLRVQSGANYDAIIRITAGVDRNARLVLSNTESAPGAGDATHFEIVNVGAANPDPVLEVTDGSNTLVQFIDRGTTGDLGVTGNGIIGGPTAVGPRSLLVQSTEEASINVISGTNSDALVAITSGANRNAILSLRDPAPGAAGSTFNLMNAGVANGFPVFKITDADANTLISVTDKGDTGDLYISGNAVIGGSTAFGERSLTVQSSGAAALNVVSGAGHDAQLTITSGPNYDAKIVLQDSAPGSAGSVFEIFNDGGENVEPTLRITDGENTMMTLTDQGTVGTLRVTGNAVFGGDGVAGDRSVTVQAGGQASMNIVSGNVDDAMLTISSGADKDAKLIFIDTASGISGSRFELVNRGAENVFPKFEITDGQNTLLSVTDKGTTGDMAVTGKIECVNLEATGDVTLGDALSDSIVINAHIRQEDLVFDANSDGVGLTLRFTDPSSPRIITFPDETGTVLTSTSTVSALTTVGELSSGSIVPGFGPIVTSNNIETVGSGTITSGGTFTASGDMDCRGDVYLGDSPTDSIYIQGTVASDIVFGPGYGLSFKNQAQDKTTTIRAAFNPTSASSPPGDRVITIPDIPSGGTLHVVTKGSGMLSNVGQITMHTSAGVIQSFKMLNPQEEETFFLTNRLIKASTCTLGSATCTDPGTVIIVSIADYGTGGQVFIRAAKTANVDGSATIVTQNIHPTQQMTSQYKIAFALFN